MKGAFYPEAGVLTNLFSWFSSFTNYARFTLLTLVNGNRSRPWVDKKSRLFIGTEGKKSLAAETLTLTPISPGGPGGPSFPFSPMSPLSPLAPSRPASPFSPWGQSQVQGVKMNIQKPKAGVQRLFGLQLTILFLVHYFLNWSNNCLVSKMSQKMGKIIYACFTKAKIKLSTTFNFLPQTTN